MTGKFSIPKTQTYSRHPFTLSGLIRPHQARRLQQAKPLLDPLLKKACLLSLGSPWLFDTGAKELPRSPSAGDADRHAPDRQRWPAPAAGRPEHRPALAGHRPAQITLTQPATLAAGDISVIGSSGSNYGPVTVSGSGTSYTITLAQPINAADRVTITIGNDLIASFTRRLDVLPGDVNDDGVVNVQDMVTIRNMMLGVLGPCRRSSATSTATARSTSTTTPRCAS